LGALLVVWGISTANPAVLDHSGYYITSQEPILVIIKPQPTGNATWKLAFSYPAICGYYMWVCGLILQIGLFWIFQDVVIATLDPSLCPPRHTQLSSYANWRASYPYSAITEEHL